MIFILLRKITASILVCIIALTGITGVFENIVSDNINIANSITADAANIARPTIKLSYAHSDKINFHITNIKQFKSNTVFDVYVNGVIARKNINFKMLKDNNWYISLTHNGKTYLKPNTAYAIRVQARNYNKKSALSAAMGVKTSGTTYYSVKAGTQFYNLKGGKLYRSGSRISSSIVTTGIVVTEKGAAIRGAAIAKYKGYYIKVTQGTYKGKYIKLVDNRATRITLQDYKRRIVVDYAASMNGGSYVYGGSGYRATDCSGLVMLSYAQIGVNLPHSAAGQGSYGVPVSRYDMQPGDIIVMNGGSHVGMYIGNNQFVHAMNSYDGIRIQPASYLQYYSISTIRRII